MTNQPDQESWLGMDLEEKSYWILKVINHYRDSKSLAAKPRDKEGYQLETMLVAPQGFDHHDDEVISAVDQCTRWLLSKGFMRAFVGQSEGIYQITSKGFDLIDIDKRNTDSIDDLMIFVEARNDLEEYDADPADVLGLFVNTMEATGRTAEQTLISINNKTAINLSRLNNKNVTLNSLHHATNICKSRKWLKQKYIGSSKFGNLHITSAGVKEYDARKLETDLEEKSREAELSDSHQRAMDDGVWARTDYDYSEEEEHLNLDDRDQSDANDTHKFEHIDNILIENQMFVQAINNIRSAIADARTKTADSNQLRVEHEELQNELIDYFDVLDQGMEQLVTETDLTSNPEPVSNNTFISDWFSKHWPEAVEKLGEFANKKAAADILVPTCIVATFGIGGCVFGPLVLGATKVGGFTAGAFLGMYATGQVKSKDAVKKVQDQMDDVENP